MAHMVACNGCRVNDRHSLMYTERGVVGAWLVVVIWPIIFVTIVESQPVRLVVVMELSFFAFMQNGIIICTNMLVLVSNIHERKCDTNDMCTCPTNGSTPRRDRDQSRDECGTRMVSSTHGMQPVGTRGGLLSPADRFVQCATVRHKCRDTHTTPSRCGDGGEVCVRPIMHGAHVVFTTRSASLAARLQQRPHTHRFLNSEWTHGSMSNTKKDAHQQQQQLLQELWRLLAEVAQVRMCAAHVLHMEKVMYAIRQCDVSHARGPAEAASATRIVRDALALVNDVGTHALWSSTHWVRFLRKHRVCLNTTEPNEPNETTTRKTTTTTTTNYGSVQELYLDFMQSLRQGHEAKGQEDVKHTRQPAHACATTLSASLPATTTTLPDIHRTVTRQGASHDMPNRLCGGSREHVAHHSGVMESELVTMSAREDAKGSGGDHTPDVLDGWNHSMKGVHSTRVGDHTNRRRMQSGRATGAFRSAHRDMCTYAFIYPYAEVGSSHFARVAVEPVCNVCESQDDFNTGVSFADRAAWATLAMGEETDCVECASTSTRSAPIAFLLPHRVRSARCCDVYRPTCSPLNWLNCLRVVRDAWCPWSRHFTGLETICCWKRIGRCVRRTG